MKLIRHSNEIAAHCRGGALTIGNFDGVHRGHVQIIRCLKEWAIRLDGPAVVFTFDPHPGCILRPELAPVPLTWIDRKADLLAELGVDVVVAYPTDKSLLDLDYESFFERIVRTQFGARAIVEGPNFCFGKDRLGDTQKLLALCRRHGIELTIVEPLQVGGRYISSSRLRELIRNGNVETATQWLTHPYRIRGMVTHGQSRGAHLGFPTANLEAVDTLTPASGVYAGRAYVDHRRHTAAIHIGPNLTFADHNSKIEVHLLDFAGSLYGQPLEVDFVGRLRDIRQFDSTQELTDQIQRDIAETRRVVQEVLP